MHNDYGCLRWFAPTPFFAADFLTAVKGPEMAKAGGVMTLTEVYCLYNQTRGLAGKDQMVAPEDLVQAW